MAIIYMPENLPAIHQTMNPEKLSVMIKNGRHEAQKHGFTDPASQVHFITLMWQIGPDFHHFPGFQAIANATRQPGPERIEQLYQVNEDQRNTAARGNDDRQWFREAA